jgi:ATP synthase F1 gamma subunit
MPTKTVIKGELEFNGTMKSLVEALKGIAAAQFQTLKKKKTEKFEKFDSYFTSFFQMVGLAGIDHFVLKPKNDCMGVIVIASDIGFMGALNAKLCNMAISVAGNREAEFIVTGKRGAAKLKSAGKKVVVFPAIDERKRYQQALDIKDYCLKQCHENKLGRLQLVYANPITFTSQKVEAIKLLPAGDLFNEKEKFVLQERQELSIESDPASLAEYLVGTWITCKLYETFFDSKLSEFAAQSVQLEGSLQFLVEEGKKLRLRYNKARQEEVDASMREVFAAIISAKSN